MNYNLNKEAINLINLINLIVMQDLWPTTNKIERSCWGCILRTEMHNKNWNEHTNRSIDHSVIFEEEKIVIVPVTKWEVFFVIHLLGLKKESRV